MNNKILLARTSLDVLRAKLTPIILLAKTSSSKTKSPSGSSDVFLFILILLFVVFFVWSRKARARNASGNGQGSYNARNNRQFLIGDKVVTTFGLVGRVMDIQDSMVDIEIAPNTVISVLRHAVGRVILDDDEVYGDTSAKWSNAGNDQDNDADATKSDSGKEQGEFQAKVDSKFTGETPDDDGRLSNGDMGDSDGNEREGS